MAARLAALILAILVFAPVARAQVPKPSANELETVVPPKLISDPTLAYPEGASGDATVILTLVVGVNGKVQSATAAQANAPFSELAESAARSWLFEPASRGGVPVAAKIRMEVVFLQPPSDDSDEGPERAADPTAPPPEAKQKPDPEQLELQPVEIQVRGERSEPSRSASLSRAEVRQIPGTFGDPFRAIEALPGVTPIVSGLPFFFVRGAPPGNVGYFLDGIRVPLLFHVGVGPSVVHPALIDRVDLYPGGYPARFGRFAGGIVAGETVPPEKELHGEYNLRLFDAGALAEAPFADNRATLLVGGRYSYTALLLSVLSPETTLEYWDYQARLSYDATPNDRLGVFAFGSYDFLGQKTQTETLTLFATEFHRIDLRYDRDLDDRGTLRAAFTVGLDRSSLQQDRSVQNYIAATRTEANYRLSRHVLLRAGTDLELNTYEIDLGLDDLSPATQRVAGFFSSRTDMAIGVRSDLVLSVDDALEVTPGVRMDLFGSQGVTAAAIDPRLAVRTKVTERVHLLTALGIAHQPPSFVVPVPGFQPAGLEAGLQRSIQESMGVELELGDATTFTGTVFQNAFFNMTDPLGSTSPVLTGCAPGAFPIDSIAGDRGNQPDNPSLCGVPRFPPGTLGPDRSGGGGQGADSRGGTRAANAFAVRTRGSSYGLELFLKRRLTSNLGGFVSYTLSRSLRSHENRHYVATFDRTHVANAAVAYNLGRRWRAGTRIVFYTGLPKAPDPSDPESTRLPPFFRVDLRLEKRWQLGQKTWLSFVAEWMNATLSKEAVSTTCTLDGCEAQTIGPITIPSVGLEGGF